MKINVGCGQDLRDGFINVDKNPDLVSRGAVLCDVDAGHLSHFPQEQFTHVVCKGCLNEFQTDVVSIMQQFHGLLVPDGILEIWVAVVDNGLGAFRDPLARRYLHSDWSEYFFRGGRWQNSGIGFGFHGEFEQQENVVHGETHYIRLRKIW